MAIKITGYRIFKSSGGNKCIQCNTRMRKELTYLSPIKGKRIVHQLTSKSICLPCLEELVDNAKRMTDPLTIEKYEKRRFLEHLDKE